MSDFDDSADPELGAACNRLAAFTLPIPEGQLLDEASGLTEHDLVLILRALHRNRQTVSIQTLSMDDMNKRFGPGSPHYAASLASWTDEQILKIYEGSAKRPGDAVADAVAVEIQRRGLEV